MNFLDETTSGALGNANKKKVSSTLELAKKLGLLDKKNSSKTNTTDEIFEEPVKIDNDESSNISADFLEIIVDEELPKKTKDINVEKSNNKEVDTNKGFLTLNIENNNDTKTEKEEETKSSSSANDITQLTLKDDTNSDLIDFLLQDEKNSSNESHVDHDLSIDDVDEKTLNSIAKNQLNKDIIEDINDIDDNSILEENENENSNNSINDGLLVTQKELDKYFATLDSKESKKATEEIEKKPDNSEFNISNNIIENKPKTATNGDVLTFQSFEFKGKAKEYFKIWIVNIALTILTLGVYSAWAKVRNLRYIYGNTYLNNSNFEFNADPKKILYGRTLIALFYGVFLYATDVIYNKTLALIVVGLFVLLLPWLIKQAIRFKLKSASYRNIRFKYHGKALSFYLLAIGAILGIVAVFSPIFIAKYTSLISKDSALTLYSVLFFIYMFAGIPIIYKKFKDIMINNSSYGDAMFSFNATKGSAISTFFKIAFATAVAGFVFGLLVVAPVKLLGVNTASLSSLEDINSIIIGAIGAILYLAFIGLYKGITDGYLSNFTRNNTKLDEGEFKTSIYPYKLGIISMTNTVAIVLSLGLLYPWAKMRYLKYKIENTQFACKDYSKFKATKTTDVSTIGEEATDFFDIDIGV